MTLYQPGQDKPAGSGRKKGTPNKHSAAINQAMAELALKMVPKIERVIDQTVEERGTFAMDEVFRHFFRLVDRTKAEELAALNAPDSGPETGDDETITDTQSPDETAPHSN